MIVSNLEPSGGVSIEKELFWVADAKGAENDERASIIALNKKTIIELSESCMGGLHDDWWVSLI